MDQRSKVRIPPVASQVKHFLYPSSPRKTLLPLEDPPPLGRPSSPWETLLPLGDPPPLGRPSSPWETLLPLGDQPLAERSGVKIKHLFFLLLPTIQQASNKDIYADGVNNA